MNDTSFSSQALSALVFSFSNEVNEERIGKSFKMKNCGVGIHSISKSETPSRVYCTFTLKIKSKSLEDVQASTQKKLCSEKAWAWPPLRSILWGFSWRWWRPSSLLHYIYLRSCCGDLVMVATSSVMVVSWWLPSALVATWPRSCPLPPWQCPSPLQPHWWWWGPPWRCWLPPWWWWPTYQPTKCNEICGKIA